MSEAFRLIAEHRIDAAVLDVRLFDGFVTPVAAALAGMGVPFLLCSGYTSLSGLPTALKTEALLTKPVQEAALVHAVISLVSPDRVGRSIASHRPNSTRMD